MKKGYLFLEHTADILVRAYGSTIEDALEQATYAMFETLGSKKQEGEQVFEISESANTQQELIVNFLSSILAESEIHEVLPSKIKIQKLDMKKNTIEAKIYGTKERPKDHIKAVTYHQFKIEKKDGLFYIQILFDV